MSVVDDKLVVNDVCSMFGSHIKYLVQLQLTVPDVPQSSQTLRNAFTILMSSFAKAFTLNTTEQDRPSLKGKKAAKRLSFSPSVQHAWNTDTMVQCDECSMWRLVFSKRKLSVAVHSTLQAILEDISYITR